MLLVSVYLIILFHLIVDSFSTSVFLFRCVLHPLPLPLSSCLSCIPPLIGLPSLRLMRLSLVCYYCLCDFVCVFYFYFYFYLVCLSRRFPLLATFLSVLFCLLSLLISDSRFEAGFVADQLIRDKQQQQLFKARKTFVEYVTSAEQHADILIKAVSRANCRYHRKHVL